MIVLDEQLNRPILAQKIAAWYPGQVVMLKSLRSNSIVKDEAVETLLRTVSDPTFVTVNTADFWNVVRANARFAIVNIELRGDDVNGISNWLRKFMNLPEFKTKAKRMGVVALLRPTRIEFYRVDRKIEIMDW